MSKVLFNDLRQGLKEAIFIANHYEKVTKKMKPIKVWRFYDAPKKYQKLSTHGGDEDWLAFIPKDLIGSFRFEYQPMPLWMQSGTQFGICDVSLIPVRDGFVAIGAHA